MRLLRPGKLPLGTAVEAVATTVALGLVNGKDPLQGKGKCHQNEEELDQQFLPSVVFVISPASEFH